MTPAPDAPTAAVTVVGLGADGWAGLPDASRTALREAEVVIGGPRQLDLLPPECTGQRLAWPSPLRPAVPGLLAAHAGRRIAVLASGDPMFYGIGRALAEETGALRVLPHPSSVSYAAARLGWPLEDVEVVTLVAGPPPAWPPPCTTAGGCSSSARTPPLPARSPPCCATGASGPAGCASSNSSAATGNARPTRPPPTTGPGAGSPVIR
ncbi:hypothetical protein SVIOM74S_01990 [Streptomyces violarus]